MNIVMASLKGKLGRFYLTIYVYYTEAYVQYRIFRWIINVISHHDFSRYPDNFILHCASSVFTFLPFCSSYCPSLPLSRLLLSSYFTLQYSLRPKTHFLHTTCILFLKYLLKRVENISTQKKKLDIIVTYSACQS